MNVSFTSLLMAVVALLTLSGCIATGTRLDYNAVNSIQRGVTTEQQIRAWFGEPVTVETNQKAGVRRLTYGYRNDDSIRKDAAGVGGAALGGVIGGQIGGGSGQALASSVGVLAGGLLASNAVTARQESQFLEVLISLRTGRVSDYNFTESKGRTQSWSVNQGVAPL